MNDVAADLELLQLFLSLAEVEIIVTAKGIRYLRFRRRYALTPYEDGVAQ